MMKRGNVCAAVIVVLGTLSTVSAQQVTDLSGYWHTPLFEDNLDRGDGPAIGEWVGLPLNDAGRRAAEAWDAAILSVPEHQCQDYPADYSSNSVAPISFWKEMDPQSHNVVAWRSRLQWMGGERTIWMDGRQHPPEDAPHTWLGFSTGRWERGTLVVTTTHLKNTWLRRNGPPRSDKGTLLEHITRHGNILTIVTTVTDPVYYTEPVVRSRDFVLNVNQTMGAFVCETVEEVARPIGDIPHNLPGQNRYIDFFATEFQVPIEASRGGAHTMYPEYRTRLATLPIPPRPTPPAAAPAAPATPAPRR